MTSEQSERLLGQIILGVSTEAACDVLGITLSELSKKTDSEPLFRLALFMAQSCRDAFIDKMRALEE